MFGESKLNLILVVASVLVILIGWQFLMPIISPPPKPNEGTQNSSQTASDPAQFADNTAPNKDKASITIVDRSTAITTGPRIRIDSDRIKGSILLEGARFDDVSLKDYREAQEKTSPSISVLSPVNSMSPYFSEVGWTQIKENNIALPGSETIWKTNSSVLKTGTPITLEWDNGAGLKFLRKIEIDNNYLITVTQTIENSSNERVSLIPYGSIKLYDTPAAGQSGMFAVDSEEFVPWGMFAHGGLGVLDGIKQELSYEDMQESGDTIVPGNDGWVGITGKYWMSALIPDPSKSITAHFNHSFDNQRDIYNIGYHWQKAVDIDAGETQAITNHLFVGAKEFNTLDAYEGSLGVRDLDSAIDFGLVWFLARPLFYPIDFFYRHIGNFGVAILLLTICVRILLYPLANKAYASMSRMRKLQPDTILLRERYKDNKPKMNTEMMALYRKEKANPMAGCLPMLIQIPVFFALYSVLFATIEMRHAPFFGWIQDLSAPDPLTFITAFGALEWPAPDFLLIGIWPILFAATMLLQMKLNPQPIEPIQQKIMMFLPLLFLFMFARFPAGLVVYWTWNNVLSIGQQWLIMRRMGITRASLAADAERIKKIKEQAAAGTLPRPSSSQASGRKKKRNESSRIERSTNKTQPKRKKSYREQAEELRRERLRNKKRKLQAAEAKKRAKKRGENKQKTMKSIDSEANKKPALSRRQRRAARTDTPTEAVETNQNEKKIDHRSSEWGKNKTRPSRRGKPKKTKK